MSWNATYTRLNHILAIIIPDKDRARRFVVNAGVASGNIAFKDAAIDNWFNILDEAIKQRKVPHLLATIQAEYQNHPELNELLQQHFPDLPRSPLPSPSRPLSVSPNLLSQPLPDYFHKTCDRKEQMTALEDLVLTRQNNLKVAFIQGTEKDHPFDLVDRFLIEKGSSRRIFPSEKKADTALHAVEVMAEEMTDRVLFNRMGQFLLGQEFQGFAGQDPSLVIQKARDYQFDMIITVVRVYWGRKSLKMLKYLLDFWKQAQHEPIEILLFICLLEEEQEHKGLAAWFNRKKTNHLEKVILQLIKETLGDAALPDPEQGRTGPWKLVALGPIEKDELESLIRIHDVWLKLSRNPRKAELLARYQAMEDKIDMAVAVDFLKEIVFEIKNTR